MAATAKLSNPMRVSVPMDLIPQEPEPLINLPSLLIGIVIGQAIALFVTRFFGV